MSEVQYSPLGGVTASKLGDINKPGILKPVSTGGDTFLLIERETTIFGVRLSGKYRFHFFANQPDNFWRGLFFPNTEILIDFSSAIDALSAYAEPGTLILRNEILAIKGFESEGEMVKQFRDEFPLPVKVDGGSDDMKIIFKRWAIGLKEGGDYRILWSFKAEDAGN